jgi:hypothetical protein
MCRDALVLVSHLRHGGNVQIPGLFKVGVWTVLAVQLDTLALQALDSARIAFNGAYQVT